MTRALPLTERQARALYRAADKEGGIAEVKIGNTVVRLIPATLAQDRSVLDPAREPESFDTLEDYLSWRDRSGAGENQGHP